MAGLSSGVHTLTCADSDNPSDNALEASEQFDRAEPRSDHAK
jgi:hypothetical protein